MKVHARKIISASCALAMTVSSFTGLAQTVPQDKSRESAPRRVERVEERGTIILRTTDGDTFQEPAAPPMPAVPQIFSFGQDGVERTFQFVSSEMSFDSKVVKGAPYSADAVTETTQTLMDGNRIVHRTTSQVFRDSEGRTRREQTLNLIGPLAANVDVPRMIFINDPVANVNYSLDPRSRTATKMGFRTFVRTPMALAPRAPESSEAQPVAPRRVNVAGSALQGNATRRVQPPYPPIAKAARASGAVQVQVTVNEAGEVTEASAVSGHPLLRDSAVEAARQWRFKPTLLGGQPVKISGLLTFNFTLSDEGEQPPPGDVLLNSKEGEILMAARPKVLAEGHLPMGGDILAGVKAMSETHQAKKESLGKQTIEGVEAEGTRWTTTIPAGEIGNERPIEIVTERWYSPELQTDLLRRHFDPRTGENVYKLINVSRREPDHSLFEVPSDYTIKEGPPGTFRWEYKKEK
ncbi:MAG TPA: energy transducer TonB [Blastocatellia bacterium]|nr:energy transducer TonB [Blastocatellia bacterium]